MTDQPLTLGGRYELDSIIGRGGMAEVWSARDIRLGRRVAVKRLRVDLATDQTFQARFQREAQSAAGLNHPNIVSVYDTGEMVDPRTGVIVPYIVMELLEGQTLREILRSDQPISPERAFEYTMGVLEALSFSHKRDIVHRDIKPANVMITANGQVKVMDFGIARAVSDTSATMTQTAAVIGTAQYLSPEQARGEQVDSRSDIYSAGCLLYELLTRRPPFIGDSPVSVAYQHVREIPVPPSQLDNEITAQMDAVTLKALAKNPEERYQSARQMHDDCWRLLNGHQITASLPAIVPATEVIDAAPTRALPAEHDTWYGNADETESYEEPEPETKPKKRVSAATWVMLALLLILIGVLGVFIYRVMAPNPNDTNVTVPSVIGFQEDAARELITQEQLVARVQHTNGSAEGKGTVVEQSPSADSQVEIGSTVTITINDGPPVATIPDGLVGMTEKDALTALKAAGYTNVSVLDAPARQETPESREGDVVEVNPASGTQLATDQQVTIYIATGQSSIPNVIGMSEENARATLTTSGFTEIEARYTQTDSASPGTVVSVLPNVGDLWSRSSKVIIEIAEAVPVPEPSHEVITPSVPAAQQGTPAPEPSS